MSKYIQELMSPQLMMAIYLFVGFIAALYILSVVYVFIDAKRRGVNAFWAWGIVSLIPFVGLIAYLVLRPSLILQTARSKNSIWRCASASLPSTAAAPSAAAPSRRTLWCAPCATPRCATSAPAAIVPSMPTGRCAPTAELTFNSARAACRL